MAHIASTPGASNTGSGVWTALKILAALTPLLVLLQAVLAGRGLYVNHDFIDIHGMVANGIALVVLAQALLAYLALARGNAGRGLFGVCLAIVVLVIAQIGLGYAGDDGGNAAAIHIPNGVLILGLSVVAFMLTRTPASATRTTH